MMADDKVSEMQYATVPNVSWARRRKLNQDWLKRSRYETPWENEPLPNVPDEEMDK